MIYTRWGRPVIITGDCGEHVDKRYPNPIRLVRVRHVEEFESYRIAHALRADGGMAEIDRAIKEAPKLKLPEQKLKQALEEAY